MSFLLDLSLSTATYGIFGAIVLTVVQGGLVWATAKLFAEMLGSTNWVAKVFTIFVSWMSWVLGGGIVWALLGGGGGFFEGGIWFFAVLPTGIYGSIAAAILWLVLSADGSEKSHG